MEEVMKTMMIAAAVLIGSSLAVQAAPLKQKHTARVSACLTRQHAVLALLDQHGAYLPSVSPTLDRMRTQCMPVNHNVNRRDFLTPST
jgi:hypothetical protein